MYMFKSIVLSHRDRTAGGPGASAHVVNLLYSSHLAVSVTLINTVASYCCALFNQVADTRVTLH